MNESAPGANMLAMRAWTFVAVAALAGLSACSDDSDDAAANGGGSGGQGASGGSSGGPDGGGSAGQSGAGGNGGASGNGAAGGGSGGSANASGSGGSTASGGSSGAAGAPACMAGAFLESIGRNHLLVGASMSDATATAAPFDLRYLYLAGGNFDGGVPCASCTACYAGGQSCANTNTNGCRWWGCWQWDQDPPGKYVRDFLDRAEADGQIPMLTYYQVLQSTGVTEGDAEVMALNDANFMAGFYADFRFMLQQIGPRLGFVHVEPDLWGYAQQTANDPTTLSAAVASSNAADCASLPNTVAGVGQCLIAMARKHAPGAKIGLHASAWGTGIDVHLNRDASFDVAGEARKLGTFMRAVGADRGDFLVVEISDRDAGYYASISQNRWWDATNATLPNYEQGFAWATALSVEVGLPLLWWQLPVGNMSLSNTDGQWQDNRVDYLISHTDDVARAHGIGMAFGAGRGDQTTPETDGGNLISKVQAYASNPQAACP